MKVKVTRKFQVTIPPRDSKKVDVKVGDQLMVREEEDKIVFTKVPSLKEPAEAWEHIESTEDFMEGTRRAGKHGNYNNS
ncbi:MAG: AbrB/MazE/SpoVT family DNA-binding domain-containing protein [Candidatus Freyarchaeota archaeon]|nr:AbrB/MazE/SpoVT family DNA-binding domain-containing protein [Candidatus Jordarchaeia archaeon]MBS7270139.1 AbrB/MazE/SpoVT family DNA-binding domain-containing protein [Candidatus Jordarchaeia archaeon]MBS7281434.1 AbrB/MazE/SpoVT family DNA-binding domain-containing protein [Candidatus Jordarchaeia archaeon]